MTVSVATAGRLRRNLPAVSISHPVIYISLDPFKKQSGWQVRCNRRREASCHVFMRATWHRVFVLWDTSLCVVVGHGDCMELMCTLCYQRAMSFLWLPLSDMSRNDTCTRCPCCVLSFQVQFRSTLNCGNPGVSTKPSLTTLISCWQFLVMCCSGNKGSFLELFMLHVSCDFHSTLTFCLGSLKDLIFYCRYFLFCEE